MKETCQLSEILESKMHHFAFKDYYLLECTGKNWMDYESLMSFIAWTKLYPCKIHHVEALTTNMTVFGAGASGT